MRHILCLLLCSTGAWVAPGAASARVPLFRSGTPDSPSARVISVAVIAESALRGNDIWKIDATRIVNDASLVFQEVAGIKFKIKTYGYWTCKDTWGRGPLINLLSGFLGHLKSDGSGGCEIVIGLVPEGPAGPVHPGLADYLNGVVLIEYLKAKGGMSFVLLHEACHLFGAIDLRQTGSVMSLRDPTFRLDDFTQSIVRINRERSFRAGRSPLVNGRIIDAIEIYRNRQALGLGEDELDICLSVLRKLTHASDDL